MPLSSASGRLFRAVVQRQVNPASSSPEKAPCPYLRFVGSSQSNGGFPWASPLCCENGYLCALRLLSSRVGSLRRYVQRFRQDFWRIKKSFGTPTVRQISFRLSVEQPESQRILILGILSVSPSFEASFSIRHKNYSHSSNVVKYPSYAQGG
jgi:hypothetical protein